jgi:hypothetical protein
MVQIPKAYRGIRIAALPIQYTAIEHSTFARPHDILQKLFWKGHRHAPAEVPFKGKRKQYKSSGDVMLRHHFL